MTSIKSIIIFRALQLGDLLCTVPALRALRAAYPDAHIAIAGMPWMKWLVERFPNYLDEFIWFPGYPGLPEQKLAPAATADFIKTVIDRRFDLALQMQGNGSIVNPLVELFGARYTAGFFNRNDYFPDSPLFMPYPDGISEVHRHLKLMEHIGVPSQGDALEFPVLPQDKAELENAGLFLTEKYICVHPGSRGVERRWPPKLFAKLADTFALKGYKVVVTGTKEEMPIVDQVITYMQSVPITAAGRTSLGAMGALLQNAEGLLSNCTGVSHVASGLRLKSIVISMDGEPERWAPLNKDLHFTINWLETPDFALVEQAAENLF